MSKRAPAPTPKGRGRAAPRGPPPRQRVQQPMVYSTMPTQNLQYVNPHQQHPQQMSFNQHPQYAPQQNDPRELERLRLVAERQNQEFEKKRSAHFSGRKIEEEEEANFTGDPNAGFEHYKFENNIATRHIANKNPNCVCRVEQYLNLQTNFAPPESVARLDSLFRGMMKKMRIVNESIVEGKVDLLSLVRTNLFNGPKRVRVDLKNSSFRGTFGSLHYYHGTIEMESKISMSLKKLNEKPYPLYKGTGTVYLEPYIHSQHFLFVQLNGVMNVDKEIFEACEGSLKFETVWIKGLATKIWGKEGLTEHRFEGKGWVLLRLPVPPSEVQILKLNKKRPVVCCDGNYVILRKGANVTFSLKRMGKGLGKLFSKMTHGEGILNKYELKDPSDKGEVWICPTWRQRDDSLMQDFVGNIPTRVTRGVVKKSAKTVMGEKNYLAYQRSKKYL